MGGTLLLPGLKSPALVQRRNSLCCRMRSQWWKQCLTVPVTVQHSRAAQMVKVSHRTSAGHADIAELAAFRRRCVPLAESARSASSATSGPCTWPRVASGQGQLAFSHLRSKTTSHSYLTLRNKFSPARWDVPKQVPRRMPSLQM